MSNMSYCRFQNTLHDLHDCNDHLHDELSDDEKQARRALVRLCREIADDAGDDFEVSK